MKCSLRSSKRFIRRLRRLDAEQDSKQGKTAAEPTVSISRPVLSILILNLCKLRNLRM
jgi:hypothetical protein